MDAVLDLSHEYPFASACLVLGASWYVLTRLRSPGATLSSQPGGLSREAALAAARERQQQMLADASLQSKEQAAARAPRATAPESARKEAAPSAANRSQAAADAAAARFASQQAPSPPPAASAKRKETIAEKLARIEKGKGSSDFNPLHGQSGSGGAGRAINRKKGGG